MLELYIQIGNSIYVVNHSSLKIDDVLLDTKDNHIYRAIRNNQQVDTSVMRVVRTNDTFIGSDPSVVFDTELAMPCA